MRRKRLRRRHRSGLRKRVAYGAPLLLAPAVAGAVKRFLRRRSAPSTDEPGAPGSRQDETAPRPGVHAISLHRTHESERFDEALAALRGQLGERAVGDADENGFFEVEVEAESWDDAASKVRDAVAAAGADEVVELGEPSGRLDR